MKDESCEYSLSRFQKYLLLSPKYWEIVPVKIIQFISLNSFKKEIIILLSDFNDFYVFVLTF